jgi:hypothetical protein
VDGRLELPKLDIAGSTPVARSNFFPPKIQRGFFPLADSNPKRMYTDLWPSHFVDGGETIVETESLKAESLDPAAGLKSMKNGGLI